MRIGAQTVRTVVWPWAVQNHAHTAPGTIGMGPSVVLERQEGHARAQILAARPAGTTRGDYGYHGVHTGRARQQRAGRGGDACGCACGATGEAHHVLGGKLSGGRGGRSWVGGDVGATSAVGGALGAVGRTPGLAGGCAGRACSVGWGGVRATGTSPPLLRPSAFSAAAGFSAATAKGAGGAVRMRSTHARRTEDSEESAGKGFGSAPSGER